MKTAALIERLTSAADTLEDRGFGWPSSSRTAEEMARAFASSTFPLRLFLAWLARTPEAVEEIDEIFQNVKDNGTDPITPVVDPVKVDPVKVPVKPDPAQISEPGKPGVKGATADSFVVTIDNAAAMIGRKEFATRPVQSTDLDGPTGLGEVPVFRGHQAAEGVDGKPYRARAKFRDGKIYFVEFLDKRGPLYFLRIVDGPSAGTAVTTSIEFIEPKSRDEVKALFANTPDAEDDFNFSPFDGIKDQWEEDTPIPF